MSKPEPSTLNDTRRILYKIEPTVTVELIGLLFKNQDGERGARELLRVPRMRQHVVSCERQLSRLGLALDGRRRSDVRTNRAPSPYRLAQYDRARLYDEVCSEPTLKVARRYGISDVALSKVCNSWRCLSRQEDIGRRRKRVEQSPPAEARALPRGNTRTRLESERAESVMTCGSGSQ